MTPSVFFDLSMFAHRELFQENAFVWEALSKIAPYLKSKVLGTIETEIPPGAFLENREQIHIGKGCIVEPGAYIRGPCWIGEGSVIRHGAYIRGYVIAGRSCVIGHDSELKNSILLDEAHAAHFAYVGDSILGNKVNLGAGTKCANLKFDNSSITIFLEGKAINTGLRKFGAILGDNTQTGCNVVTNPGTILGPNVFCYPCTNVSGIVPGNSIVKSDQKLKITPRK
jgi:NDP-sugar pyrophosphorylase family protein